MGLFLELYEFVLRQLRLPVYVVSIVSSAYLKMPVTKLEVMDNMQESRVERLDQGHLLGPSYLLPISSTQHQSGERKIKRKGGTSGCSAATSLQLKRGK